MQLADFICKPLMHGAPPSLRILPPYLDGDARKDHFVLYCSNSSGNFILQLLLHDTSSKTYVIRQPWSWEALLRLRFLMIIVPRA